MGTAAASTSTHAINFAWLLRLRWGAILGQAATVIAASRLLGIRLPEVALFVVIGVEAASNVIGLAAARSGRPPREWWLVLTMGFDSLVLTALLYLSGGPVNPFSFLYLVQIALAAVVLRARFTWMLVALSMAGSAVLFADSRPLVLGGSHQEHMSIHLRGMWVAFTVAAGFIVYSLLRVTRALADREADLAAARQLAAQQEKLASLATLAAGAAHELSTPLSTIFLTARELERTLGRGAPAPEPLLEDVRLIRSQVERCRQILERMAADAGQSAGEGSEPIQVGELVERAVRGALARPGAAPVVIECDRAVQAAELRLPPRAVAEALRALVKNAQQASPPGEPVRICATVASGALTVEVHDRGAGMPDEVLARAGEPFFTTKAPGEGMGLGLFLARALTERLGGELSLRSQAGAGTRAVMRLPLDSRAGEALGLPVVAEGRAGHAKNHRMGEAS